MSGEELENLGRNLELLRVCDVLSLFVCLNEPGGDAYPPYPRGFKFGGELSADLGGPCNPAP
jgi:hypothetical protein